MTKGYMFRSKNLDVNYADDDSISIVLEAEGALRPQAEKNQNNKAAMKKKATTKKKNNKKKTTKKALPTKTAKATSKKTGRDDNASKKEEADDGSKKNPTEENPTVDFDGYTTRRPCPSSVDEMSDVDVLMGNRGQKTSVHWHQNKHFHALIEQYVEKYISAPCGGGKKTAVAHEVYSEIELSGGRFFEMTKNGSLHEVSVPRRIVKVQHTLRSAVRSRKGLKPAAKKVGGQAKKAKKKAIQVKKATQAKKAVPGKKVEKQQPASKLASSIIAKGPGIKSANVRPVVASSNPSQVQPKRGPGRPKKNQRVVLAQPKALPRSAFSKLPSSTHLVPKAMDKTITKGNAATSDAAMKKNTKRGRPKGSTNRKKKPAPSKKKIEPKNTSSPKKIGSFMPPLPPLSPNLHPLPLLAHPQQDIFRPVVASTSTTTTNSRNIKQSSCSAAPPELLSSPSLSLLQALLPNDVDNEKNFHTDAASSNIFDDAAAEHDTAENDALIEFSKMVAPVPVSPLLKKSRRPMHAGGVTHETSNICPLQPLDTAAVHCLMSEPFFSFE